MERNKGRSNSYDIQAFKMRHPSLYLDWYTHVPNVKHDFRSSGLTHLKYDLTLGEIDLSANYVHGNPQTAELLAQRYHVQPENIFVSSEGASGQNARIIRCIAERNRKKTEAIVEYPTYEPLLRQVQEHFSRVKRLERSEKQDYAINVDALRKMISRKTGLLVLTNPHAPSGAISDSRELREIMKVANEQNIHVMCDEIYAEFDRNAIPSVFSADPERCIATTSFTKAYGLGGLKLGIALASKELVDWLYSDVLNTVGNSPNVVQAIATELLTNGMQKLEMHKQKWARIKNETEKWLEQKGLEYSPNKVGVTYWLKLPIKDTYRWINEHAIPHFGFASVPGSFFLFKSGYTLVKSNMIRLGLGGLDPEKSNLTSAFEVFEKAMNTWP